MTRNRLRELRESRNGTGVSLEQVSRRTGISRSHLCRIEQGRRQPSVRVLFKLARFFHCRIDDIFQDSEPQ